MARKFEAPFRPQRASDRVSQPFADGLVRIYDVCDVAAPGMKPQEGLTLTLTLRYAERKLGINRYYAAKQNRVEVERVLRVPRVNGLNTQQVAITEDGRQYRIDMVQLAADVLPPSVDITLAAISQDYAAEVIRQ